MKKYLLGLVALVLAVTLNSFTIGGSKETKDNTSFYWYRTNEAGTSLVSFYDEGAKEDIADLSDCDDNQIQPFCMRGYSSPQSLGDAPIPSDEVLRKEPVNKR